MVAVPRVSVVVPAFQNAPFIRATVASVLAQTYPDFELVIADHGSSDGTWEILQELAADPRVRLLRTSAGGGAVRNWNRVTERRGASSSSWSVATTCWRPMLWRDRSRSSTHTTPP